MPIVAIDDVTAIVRSAASAADGWHDLRAACAKAQPSDLWPALPAPNIARDVERAATWLSGQLAQPGAPRPARGLYLGLDTLNMNDGAGFNVALGATSRCNPLELDPDWPSSCEWEGADHLIEGLVALQATYQADEWKVEREFADYHLFLGYSGLILADALAMLAVGEPLLAVFGFHDGDLFFLARRAPGGIERICQAL